MKSFVAAFVVAALVGSILTPVVRRVALRIGALSAPGGRHVHRQSTPRLGGVAMLVAFLVPLVALFFVEAGVNQAFLRDRHRVIGLFVGCTIMCIVGAIDDARGLRATLKLYAQLAVAVLAYACGFRIDAILLPLVGSISMGVFALPVTILWIVGVVNAVNLIDGLDGLAGGVAFFAGLTNFIVAYILGATWVALVMAAMLGAILGFLFYNFNPARIFMGDSGSYLLGFVLAATSLAGAPKTSTAVSLLVPILALGVPILDTLFAMVRRILERRSVFSPDRGHIHHRLLDMGITHRRAVLIIYGVSIVFTAAAIAISFGRVWQVGLALLAATIVLIGLVRFVGYFEVLHTRVRQKARFRSRDAELLRRILPLVPGLFEDARNEVDVFEALAETCARAHLGAVHVVDRSAPDRPAFVWESPDLADSGRRDCVEATFPLGRDDGARADARFLWVSDFGEVSPQTDILLQVVTDMLELHLRRVSSRLVSAEPAPIWSESLLPPVRATVPDNSAA